MSETQFTVFLVFSFLTTIALLVLGVLAFLLKVKGAKAFSALCILFALWCFSIGGKMLSTNEQTAFFWSVIITVAGSFAPTVFLLFAVRYTGFRVKMRWWKYGLWFIEPVIAIFIYLVPTLRHLYINKFFYEEVMGYLVTVDWQVGSLYVVHSIFSALYVILGDALIIRHAIEWNRDSRKKIFWLIAATSLPVLTTICRMFHLIPGVRLNLDVFAFAIASGIAGIVLYREDILGSQPVSGRQLMDELPDPLLVFDLDGDIREINPAAKSHFRFPLDSGVQQQLKTFMTDSILLEGRHIQEQIHVLQDDTLHHYEVHLSPLHQGSRMTGFQVFFRDVTALTQSLKQLELLATTDPLTGLFNRRFFYDEGNRYHALAIRHLRPISVLTFDFDNFKKINDAYGHPFGDEVLIKVAEVVQSTCRKADVAARFGGDEFFILLPETTADEAVILATRLQEQLQHESLVVNELNTPIHISIGIASFNPEMSKSNISLDELMREADLKLYEAKHEGRNQIRSIVF